MSNFIIFLSGFAASLVVYGLLAKYFWWESLKSMPSSKANALTILPHTFRHLGLLALVPEVVGEPLTKTSFAHLLAYGDAVVTPLALLAFVLWLVPCNSARAVTWVFSIVATLDLLNALVGALTLPVTSYAVGAFWLVLVCVVPLLVITQGMIFVRLTKG